MSTLFLVTLQIKPPEGDWVNPMPTSVVTGEAKRDALIEMHRRHDPSYGGIVGPSKKTPRRVLVRTVHLVSAEHIDL